MLRELHLTNFKSFAADSTPIPFAPVTLLVGANASGKSNVFDALRFLQGVGMGLSVPEILEQGKWEGGRQIHLPLRGGSTGVCWRGGEEFAIQTTVDGPGTLDVTNKMAIRSEQRHEIRCNTKGVVAEVLEAAESNSRPRKCYGVATGGPSAPSSFLATAMERPRERPEEEDDSSEGTAYWVFHASHLSARYRQLRFLDPRPPLMGEYVPADVQDLGAHGENLSAIVRRICLNDDDKQRYLEWLSALCAPPVLDILCDVTKLNGVMAMLIEGDIDSKPLALRSLSDGTLRFMALLAAMFTAPEGSVFLLEEIETGLHPTRIHLLVELFEQFAESRNLQIIATTHSSQALLGLSPKALGDVVLFARPEETQGTVTSRLGDLPDFDEVVQTSKIDRLFTTGWLERAL